MTFDGADPYNHRVRTRSIAALGLFAALTAVVAHAAEGRVVLERYLSRVASAPLRDLTLEQDLTLFNPEGRAAFATGTQRVVIKLPDRQRVEHTVDGRVDVRLTVGDRTWRRDPEGKVSSVAGARGQGTTLALLLRRTPDEVLAEWRALGIRDDRSHQARLAGRTVTVLGAQQGERDRPAAWLDAEYGVLRFVARESADSGVVMTDLVFSDHRPLLGGVFYPHRQETFRSGKLLLRTIVRSVAVNSDPPDGLFDPAGLK